MSDRKNVITKCLKKCPFCGSVGDDNFGLTMSNMPDRILPKKKFNIFCKTCGSRGPSVICVETNFDEYTDEKDLARKRWNIRE